MKKITLCLSVLMIAACSQAQPPIEEQFLNALQEGDAETAQSLICWPEGWKDYPLYALRSYEINSSAEAQSEIDPSLSYREVKITATHGSTQEQKDWTIQVWESDDYFLEAKAVAKKLAELNVRTVPEKREFYSSNETCLEVERPAEEEPTP